MIKNFKLIIEYDGSAYHGWQRQKKDRTVQQEIENALSTMMNRAISVNGSGRTDAGVHALGQTANFKCRTTLSPGVFLKGLNSLLPDDIVIKTCSPVDSSFHARYDARSKTYFYTILNKNLPSAIARQYVWHIRRKLDSDLMQAALSHIIGTHDFKAFEGTGSPRAHTTRTVRDARISDTGRGDIRFDITADGFLRYMVRNLVGTLVDVGHGKTSPGDFKQILESKNRNLAGATAPPQGLFLAHVNY
jgi:tRNA pseudouridine38-40 synthase